MNFLKQIFLAIARRMGLDLVEQPTEENDFFDTQYLSITATLSERLSTITLMGSNMVVEGESERAKMIQDCMTELQQEHLKDACDYALGTGSAIIKPNTKDGKFGFDIIPEANYRITGYVGRYIYSVLIITGKYKRYSHEYVLVESQEIKTDASGTKYIEVKYYAYRDGDSVSLSETKWSDRKDYRIANVDRLLFGRMKCPTTNRKDVNNPNGVSITFGCDEVVENCKDSYRQYNDEREDKRTMIFADKTLFRKDKEGRAVLPDGKERLFMKMQAGRNVDNTMLDTYSPDIRETPLDNSIERNFRMLELAVGIGEGILSKSTLTYTNMDEVRSSKQATHSFITAFRKQIDGAIEDLLYALDIIANYNGTSPQGDYDAHMEWSDEYMTSVSERFAQMMQAEGAGWIQAAEGRAVLMNEDIDDAKEAIEEIREDAKQRMEEAMMAKQNLMTGGEE